jgi:tRNA modification GTPase
MSDVRRSQSRPDSGAGVRVRADTIVATSTAPGRGAIAVVRLSGPDVERIGRAVISPWPDRPRTLTRCAVREPGDNGAAIDDALAVIFAAPRSYTGESLLEIHTHGGRYVPPAVEAALVKAGARPAAPGEFTERAVLNGKLDLVRAEAVGEIVDARTRALHRSALHALSGAQSSQYSDLRARAISLEALIAYDVDFPDEDDGPIARERIEGAARDLHALLEELCAGAARATLARDGALVILAGAPNVGKSSLLNAMTGEARVIVSDEPGTTRDAIEVLLDADPWPLRLVDTAGIRDATGPVERLGIEVSERYLQSADVVLLCTDSESIEPKVRARVEELTRGTVLVVRTKSDLASEREAQLGDHAVSARTGHGLAELRAGIERAVVQRAGLSERTNLVVASARQRAALSTARDEIAMFLAAWRARELPAPVVASHLRSATVALDELIGVIDVDDVLGRIFSTFCVGK